MPWKECKPMDEKLRFVARLLEGEIRPKRTRPRPTLVDGSIPRQPDVHNLCCSGDIRIQAAIVIPPRVFGWTSERVPLNVDLHRHALSPWVAIAFFCVGA